MLANVQQTTIKPIIEAAVAYLEDAEATDSNESAPLYEELNRHYRRRLAGLQTGDRDRRDSSPH